MKLGMDRAELSGGGWLVGAWLESPNKQRESKNASMWRETEVRGMSIRGVSGVLSFQEPGTVL